MTASVLSERSAGGYCCLPQTVPFGTNQIAVGNSLLGNANCNHFARQMDELAVYDITGQSVSQMDSKLSGLAFHFSLVIEPAAPLLLLISLCTAVWVHGRSL